MNLSESFQESSAPYNTSAFRGLSKSIRNQRLLGNCSSPIAIALVHEVRNPLSNIKLSLELLKSTAIAVGQEFYLDIIERGTEKINKLLTEFLKLTEKKEIKSRLSLHKIIDDVLEMAGDRIILKNVSVMKEYSTADFEVFVHEREIKIALSNILINAIDAMAKGKGELSLLTRSMNGEFILEIKDNGVGISKEDLDRIFRPYFTKKPNGMGLGLATSMTILSSNQVGIEVQSKLGKGSSFILHFRPFLLAPTDRS
jgi:signal transduction histidine kinase